MNGLNATLDHDKLREYWHSLILTMFKNELRASFLYFQLFLKLIKFGNELYHLLYGIKKN